MLALPKNYAPSRQIEPGETFEVVAEVMLGEDGSYSVSKLDGQELVGEAGETGEGEFDRMVRVPSDGLEA